MNLPIAESFRSIQGEGRWTGTAMFFVRLAGCSVGRGVKPFTCARWDGSEFFCDTDYRKYGELEPGKLVSIMQSHRLKRLCLTGGEPLMHDLDELIEEMDKVGYPIHVETSGTCAMPSWLYQTRPWVTLSPKKGYREEYLRRADEIKLLIGPKDELEILDPFKEYISTGSVYIQPINDVHKHNQASIDQCLYFIRQVPKLKLSIQLHKILGVR